MKKSIYLLLFSLLSLNSYSQEWEVIGHQADELKGNKDYTSYMFTDPNIGSFVCWSESEQCRIINSNGIFDYSSAYHQLLGSYGRLTAVVGLYDSNNNLKEKFDLTMYCDIDKPSSFQTRYAGILYPYVKQKKKVKKIINHLTSGNGYVRIIANSYGNAPDFDLKIPSTLVIK